MQIFIKIWEIAYRYGNQPAIKAITKLDAPTEPPPGNGQSHHKFLVDQMKRIYEDLDEVNWACAPVAVVTKINTKQKKCSQCDFNFMQGVTAEEEEEEFDDEGADDYEGPVSDPDDEDDEEM